MVKYSQMFERAMKKLGAPRKYETPEELMADVVEHFAEMENSYIEEDVLFHANGIVTRENKRHKRVLTLGKLFLHLGINGTTWNHWRHNRPDLVPVIEQAEQMIRENKFEGASAGIFNSLIIARDLGLRDATSTEITGKDGGPIEIAATDKLKAYIDGIVERSRAASSSDE